MTLTIRHLLAAVSILAVLLYACKSQPDNNKAESVEIVNLDDTTGATDAAQVLRVSEELYFSFNQFQKANDKYTVTTIKEAGDLAKIDSAQNQFLEADKAFRETLEKVELNNTNLQNQLAINSLYHIISSYRFLHKFQRVEGVTANMVGSKNTYAPTVPQPQNNPAQQLRIAELEQQVKDLENSIVSSKKTADGNLHQNQASTAQQARIAELEKQVKLLQSNVVSLKTTASPQGQQAQTNSSQEEKIARLEKELATFKRNQNINKNKVSSAEYDEMVSNIKYLNFDLRSVIKTNLALTKQYEALKKTNQVLTSELSKLKNR